MFVWKMQRIPLMPSWHLSLVLLACLMCVNTNCPADRGLYCICNYTGKPVPLSCGLVTLCVSIEKGHEGSPSEASHRIRVQSVPPLNPSLEFDRRLGDVMIERDLWIFNPCSAGLPGDGARLWTPVTLAQHIRSYRIQPKAWEEWGQTQLKKGEDVFIAHTRG